jgi:hypothetical protein
MLGVSSMIKVLHDTRRLIQSSRDSQYIGSIIYGHANKLDADLQPTLESQEKPPVVLARPADIGSSRWGSKRKFIIISY